MEIDWQKRHKSISRIINSLETEERELARHGYRLAHITDAIWLLRMAKELMHKAQ